jgi:hypothetical protein
MLEFKIWVFVVDIKNYTLIWNQTPLPVRTEQCAIQKYDFTPTLFTSKISFKVASENGQVGVPFGSVVQLTSLQVW